MIELILITVILVFLVWTTVRKPKNFPPGPIPIPFLGNYLEVYKSQTFKLFDNLQQKYGPIIGLVVPKFNVVVVAGYEACKETFANDDCMGRPDVCLIRDRFDGENYGVLFADGEGWKSQRRFTLHHFRNLGFGRRSHEGVMIREAEVLIEEVRMKNRQPFNLVEFLAASSLNITWSLLGSKRYSYTDPDLINLCSYIRQSIHSVKCFGTIAVVFPFLRYFMPKSTGYASVKNGTKGIREFVQHAIVEHAQTRDRSSPRDFIDIYLEEIEAAGNNSQEFTVKQLEGLCTDLLCAGADTSSTVIAFAILFVCLRKDIQEKIFQEINEHVGDSRPPTIEDKEKLVYTEATIMEVLRCRTPAPTVLAHRVTKETTLSGYSIPKDTILFINVYSIFMDPNYWKNPQDFSPERFITEGGKLRRDERLIPFAKGKRSCLGETLAKMSTFLLFASLVQKFTFSLPSNMPVPETDGVHGFTLAPPSFMVVATPRS